MNADQNLPDPESAANSHLEPYIMLGRIIQATNAGSADAQCGKALPFRSYLYFF
jgi:hypothetical protein